jgi:hypothetical protein
VVEEVRRRLSVWLRLTMLAISSMARFAYRGRPSSASIHDRRNLDFDASALLRADNVIKYVGERYEEDETCSSCIPGEDAAIPSGTLESTTHCSLVRDLSKHEEMDKDIAEST